MKNSDPSDGIIMAVLSEAGIDLTKEMLFGSDETVTSYQIMDIAEQMDNWTETLAQKGLTVSYEGAKFGYVTMTGGGETSILMVMEYTAT